MAGALAPSYVLKKKKEKKKEKKKLIRAALASYIVK